MGTWKFDPFHTQVEFSAKHLGMMTVRGHFNEVVAGGEIYPDDPARSKIEATTTVPVARATREMASVVGPGIGSARSNRLMSWRWQK